MSDAAPMRPWDTPFGSALAEARRLMPESYVARWDDMSDEQKRESVTDLVARLGMDFSPDRLTLAWLLEQAGVTWPA